jgi:hypothetical protein
MVGSGSRLSGAVQSIRESIAAASEIAFDAIGADDDLIDDLGLDNLSLVSLGLILEGGRGGRQGQGQDRG